MAADMDRQAHLPLEELEQRERIVVVAAPDTIVEALRQRYPLYEVVERATYLGGIAELGCGSAAAVLVQIPPFYRRAPSLIAGFRAAMHDGGRLVMCCEPAGEPTAREALRAGADDYLIHPPTGEEFDAGLGLTPANGQRPLEDAGVSVSTDEVRGLIEVMGTMREGPRSSVADAAAFLRDALRASGVRVEFASHRATAGETPGEPVLVEPIAVGGKIRGHIFVGPRPKLPYGHQDVEKLSIYAAAIARLFEAGEDRLKWQRMALTDDLSGLRNRRYLLQALTHLLRRAEAERFRLTLLILDIDDFKRYNDQFGHAVGDELIREIARLLTGCCRRHDLVTRLGGDEFAIVFWDAEEPREAGSQHPSDVLAVLQRLRDELRTREWHTLGPDARGRLTMSGGLAGFPWDARTPDELLRKADRALLNAKRLGKNRIYIVGGESLLPRGGDAE